MDSFLASDITILRAFLRSKSALLAENSTHRRRRPVPEFRQQCRHVFVYNTDSAC